MEELQRQGLFEPPTLSDLEMAMEDCLEGEEGDVQAAGLAQLETANEDFLEGEERKAPAAGRVHREKAIEDFLERDEGRVGAPGLVLADLWNADALGAPSCCAAARVSRLREMNLIQRNLPLPPCPSCLVLAQG